MRFSAFLVSHIVFSKLIMSIQLYDPFSIIPVILAAWMLYSFMLVSLLSVGLLFYYLFKDAKRFGIHLWAWFM